MIIYLLITFLVIFPKGGIKVGEIPITWGYLGIGAAFLFLLLKREIKLDRPHFLSLICLMPFQAISFFSFCINGFESAGNVIAFLVSFFLLPLFFYLYTPRFFGPQHLDFLKKGILFIASYGIFLFFFKWVTGSFIEIPLLTVNLHDFHTLETSKNIDRNGIFKLISTYNNGNLYGACMLLLAPLYFVLEKSKIKRSIIYLSLFLTLSRTIWLGVLFFTFYKSLFFKEKNRAGFLNLFFQLAFFILILAAIALLFRFSKSFFWDSNLGGRVAQFNTLESVALFSSNPFESIWEIVYLGILDAFGVLGLCSFLVGLISPLAIVFLNPTHFPSSPISKGILGGLLSYLWICLSDGSMLLIPTMAIYWFLSALLLSPEKRCLIQTAGAEKGFSI